MAMLSNLDLIRRVPLFSMLTNEQAQGIADSVVKRRFRRGELVIEAGKKSNALFILLTGRARVIAADARGRERRLGGPRAHPGGALPGAGEVAAVNAGMFHGPSFRETGAGVDFLRADTPGREVFSESDDLAPLWVHRHNGAVRRCFGKSIVIFKTSTESMF